MLLRIPNTPARMWDWENIDMVLISPAEPVAAGMSASNRVYARMTRSAGDWLASRERGMCGGRRRRKGEGEWRRKAAQVVGM
jgi:hypothetical protein